MHMARILRLALFRCTAFPYFLYTTTPIFGLILSFPIVLSILFTSVCRFPTRTINRTLFPLILFPFANSSRKLSLPFNEYSLFTCTRIAYLAECRSSETVNLCLPFLLLFLNTARPEAELILARNPCFLFLRKLLG